MRCPDCAKMVSYDTEVEPGEQDALSVEDKVVQGSYRRTLNCANCGTELKEMVFEFNEPIEVPETCSDPNGHALDVHDASAEPTDRMQDKDRKGKPIKNVRYMKHLYGVTITATVKCEHCEYTEEIAAMQEAAGSEFDELV